VEFLPSDHPLRWLFFYVTRLVGSGLTLCRHSLLGLVEPLFELFHSQLDVLKGAAFHAMRQRKFCGKQNVFLVYLPAFHKRRMSARRFQYHEVGAMSVHFKSR
jgi:hypothetical protein